MSDFLDLQGAKDLNTDAIHIGAVANSKDPVTGAAIDTHVNRVGGTDYTFKGMWGALGPVVMPWTSATGGTLTQPNQAFLHPANKNYYSWAGAYPVGGHVVAPGTDPTAVAGYVPRTDVVLREDLASETGGGLIGLSQEIASIMRGTLAYRLQDHLDASCEPFNGDLNAAITTAYNLGIGAVAFSRELPAQGVVHCKPGVAIIGTGGKASLTTTVNSTGAIVVAGVSDVHIEGFRINGSGLSDPADVQNGDTGIYINDSSNVTVMRMRVDGCYAWGVVSSGSQCKNIRYVQNRFTNIKNQSAMACDNGTSDFLVYGNIVDGCKLYGFEAEDNGATVVSNGKVMFNLFKHCVAGVAVNFGVENVEIFSNTISESDIANDISGAHGFGIFLNGNNTKWPRNLNIHHNTVVGTKKHCFGAFGPMDDITVEDNTFIKGAISGSTSDVISIAGGSKNRLIYRNNKHHVANHQSSFVLDELYDAEVTGNRFKDAGTTILNMGGTVINSAIEAPIVPASDILNMTGGDQINIGVNNYIYDKRNNDVTVVSGSAVGKSVRVSRNTKIIGVQWCINTASAPGSSDDYWVLKINGVDQSGTIQTDIANTDCWAYTQVNKLVSAGGVLTMDVASSIGYSYNYFKYRLITI